MSEYPLAARRRPATAPHATTSSVAHAVAPAHAPTTEIRVAPDLDEPVVVSGSAVTVIAGPCSVEGRAMLLDTAHAVRAAGGALLRGGAFKPRTSPYAFRGLGEEALTLLQEARAATGLPVVTELLDARQLDLVVAAADVVQIGARNMQNFSLLAAVGEAGKPVLLKRGLSATLKELLLAAEYVMAHGNPQVILCERGIRTFETATRNTLDVAAVPVLKRETHLPVFVDPSHAAGRADIVPALAVAAVAAGADGLMLEVHPDPARALSDGPQSLACAQLAPVIEAVRAAAALDGRMVTVPLAMRGALGADRALGTGHPLGTFRSSGVDHARSMALASDTLQPTEAMWAARV